MKLKVGDIIVHKTLGLMVLIETISERSSSLRNHHGNPLFRMDRLIASKEWSWILHDKTIEAGKVRLATDEDIIESLTWQLCTLNIDGISLTIMPESECIVIEEYMLDRAAIAKLKKALEELQV